MVEHENRFIKLARGTILAAAILSPLSTRFAKADTYETVDGTTSGYYCLKTVGYDGFDNGGNCGKPFYGGETISGRTAGCGSNWPPFAELQLDGMPNTVICNDKGYYIPPNHVDVYFDTDTELFLARESGMLPAQTKITRVK